MKKITVLRSFAIVVPLCLFGAPASANVIVPIIVAFAGPGMIGALIPIILVEGLILSRFGVTLETSFLAVSVANLISTLVGIPIAILLEIVHGSKLYKDTEFTKAVYVGVLKIIVICASVFFLMSYWIEAGVVGWYVVSLSNSELSSAIFYGNLVTYGVLFLLVVGSFTRDSKRRLKAVYRRAIDRSVVFGLGHARRDLAITRELRTLHPELQVDWLAQDPVTRFLEANNETIHPDSAMLANESSHIEEESGEHDLNAFQAIRNMDEILAKNFMVFQDAVEKDDYDLIIGDEAWDVDHYWHEHPNLKRAPIAWLTDFVGWVPMPDNGAREAFLTSDYNAEMIGHVEDHPEVRDRAIFVGNPSDIIPHGFGDGLPQMRDWVPKHFDFCGYILGQHADGFGERAKLRKEFGYRIGE